MHTSSKSSFHSKADRLSTIDEVIQQHLAAVLILAGGGSTRMGSPKALLKLPNGESLLDYHINEASRLGVPILVADNGQEFKIEQHNEMGLSKPLTLDSSLTSDQDDTKFIKAIEHETPIFKITDYHSSNYMDNNTQFDGPLAAILSGLLAVSKPDSNDSINSNATKFSEISVNDDTKWLLVVSCDSLISASDIWHQLTTSQNKMMLHNSSIICFSDKQNLYPLLGVYKLNLRATLKDYLDAGNKKVMSFIKPDCESVSMPSDWIGLGNLNTPDDFKYACDKAFNS